MLGDLFHTPSIEHLSTVISQVTGPAFLLAAEAQLLGVLVARMDRIVDRSRYLTAIDEEDALAYLKSEIPILKRRARLMHRAIYWGVASCIVTCVLVMLAFGAAFFSVRHELGAGLLFVLALTLFTAALVAFWREVKLGFSEFELGVTPGRIPARKSYPHA